MFVVDVLYALVIVSGACIYASTPVMYELGSELAYPVQEGIVGLTLSFVNTGVAIIFLLLLEIPSLGEGPFTPSVSAKAATTLRYGYDTVLIKSMESPQIWVATHF